MSKKFSMLAILTPLAISLFSSASSFAQTVYWSCTYDPISQSKEASNCVGLGLQALQEGGCALNEKAKPAVHAHLWGPRLGEIDVAIATRNCANTALDATPSENPAMNAEMSVCAQGEKTELKLANESLLDFTPGYVVGGSTSDAPAYICLKN